MEQRCCVNFQCWGVLLVWVIVGQGPIALAVGAGGGVWTFFSLIYLFSFLSPSLWEMARYRLKYCLKGPLNPKQPTNRIYSASCVAQPILSETSHTVRKFGMLSLACYVVLSRTLRISTMRNLFIDY